MTTSTCFNPDGSQISGYENDQFGQDVVITTWDVESGKVLTLLKENGEVVSMEYGPDGKRLLVGFANGRILVWDAEHKVKILEFQAHDDYMHSVHFSHDGSRLVSASNDKSVRIWNSESGIELFRITNTIMHFESAWFSPNDSYIFVEGSWNPGDSKSWGTDRHRWDVWSSSDFRFLYTLIETASQSVLQTRVTCSPGEQYMYVSHSFGELTDGKIVETKRGSTVATIQSQNLMGVSNGAFTDDDQRLITTNKAGNLAIYRTADGKELVEFDSSSQFGPTYIMYSGAENTLVAANEFHSIRAWRAFPYGQSIWLDSETRGKVIQRIDELRFEGSITVQVDISELEALTKILATGQDDASIPVFAEEPGMGLLILKNDIPLLQNLQVNNRPAKYTYLTELEGRSSPTLADAREISQAIRQQLQTGGPITKEFVIASEYGKLRLRAEYQSLSASLDPLYRTRNMEVRNP